MKRGYQVSRLVLALGVAAALSCASRRPPTTVLVDNSLHVTIYADGSRTERPTGIDAEDPRIGIAQGRIAQLLGHPLGFELDAGLVEQFGSDLHRAYVAALEEAASSLASCQKHQAAAFAFGAERLQQVRFSYSAIAAGEMAETVLVSSTLPIGVRSDSRRLLDGYEFCSAFERGLVEHDSRRFDLLPPSQVAATDEAAYLDHVRVTARVEGGEPTQLAVLQRGQRILAFHPHITQPAVRAAANTELVSFGSTLREVMASQPSDALVVTALGKTQRAWMQWLNESGTTLPSSERSRLAHKLLQRTDPVRAVFSAGFDAPRFGLPTVEHWLEHVSDAEPRNWEDPLERCLVAPAQRGGVPPNTSIDSPCRGAVYSDLVRTSAGLERLATLILRWHNDVLTESAVLHALRDQRAPAALALLDALAHEPKATRVALRALAEYVEWTGPPEPRAGLEPADPSALIEQVPAWWKSHPEQRPALLYLLVRLGEHREGLIVWPRLATFLGGRIQAAELTEFLALDPRNVWYVRELAHAFGPGWSRSRVLIGGLQAHLDAEARRQIRYGIRQNLERVTAALCEAGTLAELDEVREAMRSRAELYPAQSMDLNRFAARSAEELCPKLARAKPRRAGSPVLFAD
jgi:hypothetical protein